MRSERNNVSVRKIAENAGVSAAIVSAVLGNRSASGSIRFSDKTAQTVRETAREMGYVPNRLTKVIIGKETFAIGVLATFERHERYEAIIRGLARQCENRGYHLIFTPSSFKHEEQMQNIRDLLSIQVDGIVMIPSASVNVDPEIVAREHREKLALTSKIFCVDWNKDDLVYDCVEADEQLQFELALRHLQERGHRWVGIIVPSSQRRYRILTKTLEKLGMMETLETIMRGFPPANLSDQDIPELVRQVMNGPHRPTALYCWRDSFAAMAYRVCEQEYGLRIGRDMALIGMDNTRIAQSLPVPLTSMDLQDEAMAAKLFQLIDAKISAKVKTAPIRYFVEPKLVVRASSDFTIN